MFPSQAGQYISLLIVYHIFSISATPVLVHTDIAFQDDAIHSHSLSL